ncbi:efflux RND transporter periplasmic adaptor subunit [Pendulispora rubella]|uniref:Efflux RND transporter periplasmic adaptor subunit n=1 Tax=Pendulispora rubella TaxID=2741070 RepID=A0ABZ2LG04_9BACT
MSPRDHEAREPASEPAEPADTLGFALPEPATLTKTRVVSLALGALVVMGGAFLFGYLPKRQARAALEESTKVATQTSARVAVISAKVSASDRAILLPGSVQPLEETVIYPRANGYTRRWVVDIGDKVKEGQLLAEIDTPELDQELEQARAKLAQATAGIAQSNANRDFSKSTFERYKQLTSAGLASQQDLEQRRAQSLVDEANVGVSHANVEAEQANIRRLTQLKSFARVVAPFDGTITSRTIERGALVAMGNTTPLFKIAATDPMRVFVQVPQDVAPSVKTGLSAKVGVREYPSKTFDGTIWRAAGALDSATRTMNTVVRVANPTGELLGGMYAQVSLTLPTPHRVLELPSTAILNDGKGVRVAVVDNDNKIRLVPIVIERDTGATIEISSGLEGNEKIVKIVSADLSDGKTVEVVP